jgi:pimeloyl-ACP methyl ester carboxylesterase
VADRVVPGKHVPTLLVQAAEDPIAPKRRSAVIKKDLGGADELNVLTLPHVGHAMLPELPELPELPDASPP